MRTLDQNKQKMYYSNFVEEIPVYAKDDDGNILTEEIYGEIVPVIDSYTTRYSKPELFKANISYNSGETRLAEYGLNDSEYDAIICADKGKLPFTEQTIIWLKKPVIDDSSVNPYTADYKVIAIKTSLNEERFILKKRVLNDKSELNPDGNHSY